MIPTIPPHHFSLLADLGDQTRLNVTLKPRKQWRLSPTQRFSQESLQSTMPNRPELSHSLAKCASPTEILPTPEMTACADERIPPFPFLPLSMASREPRADETGGVNICSKPCVQLDLQLEQGSPVLHCNNVDMWSSPSKFRLSNDNEPSTTLTSDLNHGFNPIHPARNKGFSPALVIRPHPIRYNAP